jgi:Uma2 family endonuclease
MPIAELAPETCMPTAEFTAGQRFRLRGIDWHAYRQIAEALTGHHVRLTYDRGTLELMTISSLHGTFSRLLGRLITVLTEELNLAIRACGDMTCDREDLERGIEPDEAFYIQNVALIQGKEVIDLDVDPPPDLGLEIDISRSSRTRMRVYAALRVPEVWRFDGESLLVYLLNAAGEYVESKQSRCFPQLEVADLVPFLQKWQSMDDNSLVRAFRDWVREQVGRGWQKPV